MDPCFRGFLFHLHYRNNPANYIDLYHMDLHGLDLDRQLQTSKYAVIYQFIVKKATKNNLLHAPSSDSSLQSGLPSQNNARSKHSESAQDNFPSGQTGSLVLKRGFGRDGSARLKKFIFYYYALLKSDIQI
uniref:Uncharacterized protein n=1 Tax=Strigamia maritima TaxID=126957 RepID=T1IYW4_STRMM